MFHFRRTERISWAMLVLVGLCIVSTSWAGAITGYVLPAYPLSFSQGTQFARDGKMSPFWSDWENGGTHDYLNMTPARNGWVDGSNSFSGSTDAELNIRTAYDENSLYLMFEVTDNYWNPSVGYSKDNLMILLDKISSQEIRDANPFDLYVQPSWNWTLTYYTVEYQVAMGSQSATLPRSMDINYFSGSAMIFNSVPLTVLPTDYSGWNLDITSISPNVRRMEWKIPWTWVGCGGGIGAMPPTGQLIAMSGGYDDSDSPNQTGRKSLRWKEKDPYNDCLDKVPSHPFCDSWGDIKISNGIIEPSSGTILSPTAGDSWTAGTQKTIQWQGISASNVKIEYSFDGVRWIVIAPSTTNTGSYLWTVPAGNSPQKTTLRISDASDNDPVINSYSFFITGPSGPQTITVTSPNGGEIWSAGSMQSVTWTSTGTIGRVNVEFSTNNGASWMLLVTTDASTGIYTWKIQNSISNLCKARVIDEATGRIFDISNAPFAIMPAPTLAMISPNGGENWESATTHAITWNTTGILGDVRLEYSINDKVWTTVTSSTPNTGIYSWIVPNTPSPTCRVRVSNPETGIPVAVSSAYFTITSGPSITVTSPNGGEHWGALTSRPITWTTTGTVGNVEIALSMDGGVSWSAITSNTPGTGRFMWAIPNTPAQICLIRIRQVSDTTIGDISNTSFTIDPQPIIFLATPNGPEQYPGGTAQTIVWATTGIVPTVNVAFSRDTGKTWVPVATNLPNTGYCSWITPDFPATTYKIRVSEGTYGTPFDISDNNFTITPAPGVTLTAPNGGESWGAGSQRAITWTSRGTVGNIKIEHTINTGATWITVAASVPNNGAYAWTVPNTPSRNCKVRISGAATGAPVDMSDSMFVIAPPVRVVSHAIPKFTAMGSIYHDRLSGTVTMNVGLASAGAISAVIYGPDGKLIRRIDAGSASPGYHSIRWDGRNLQGQIIRNGCYQVKIRAGNAMFIKPLVMAR